MKNNNAIKKIIIIGILLCILVFLAIKVGFKKESLVLTIDFGNNDKKTFYSYTEKERTAWGVLQQVAAVSSLELRAGEDFWPKKINGQENGEENKIWNLYVNGTKKLESPIKIKVNVPDKVMYKFE